MDNCELHQYHRPKHLTTEEHHIVPQSWQGAFKPVNFTPIPNTLGPLGIPLWDRRTATLCPTGHRNVHHWLVMFMRAVSTADSVQGEAAIRSLVLAVLHALKQRVTNETQMAQLGMIRFDSSGGDLKILPPLGLWGQA